VLSEEATVFAMPGADTKCAEGSYEPVVRRLFDACRVDQDGLNDPAALDMYALRHVQADELDAQEIGDRLDACAAQGAWLILTFEDLAEREEKHARACAAVASRRDRVWAAPIGEVLQSLRTAEAAGS